MHIYNATLIKVVDGDTVDLNIDLGFSIHTKQRIRLTKIDTPELRSPDLEEKALAQKAKQYVIDRLTDQPIRIVTFKPDKYGRYLGEIYVGDATQSINDELIEQRLAVKYVFRQKSNFSELIAFHQ